MKCCNGQVPPPPKSVSYGFTLIEIVVGIVVSAIALTFLATLFFSNANRSVEPILQIRAAEFGQALMDEILSKRFDETTPLGGVPACTTCSAAAGFNDGESRDEFDDVDDYNVYCAGFGDLYDAQNTNLSAPGEPFEGYQMRVCVDYDGDFDGAADTDINAKLITVEILLPSGAGLGDPMVFSAYRGNF